MSQLRETSKRKEKKRLCAFTAACDCCHVVIPLRVCPPGRDLRKNSLTHCLGGHSLEIHPGPEEWGRKARPSSSTSFRAALTFLFKEWEDSRFQPCFHRGGVFFLSEVLWVETFRKQKYKEQYKLLQQHTSISTEISQHNHTNTLSWTDNVLKVTLNLTTFTSKQINTML